MVAETMNGVNYAKGYVTANGKIPQGNVGKKICQYEEYTLASDALEVDDVILGPVLPKGARVINAWANCASLGTTGKLEYGHEASVDMDGGTIAEDTNAFLTETAFDAGGQAVSITMFEELDNAGVSLQFNQDTQTFLTCTEASTNTDVTIQFGIEYILD